MIIKDFIHPQFRSTDLFSKATVNITLSEFQREKFVGDPTKEKVYRLLKEASG